MRKKKSEEMRIWSWIAPHETWMQVDQGSEAEMTAALARRREAAAKHAPDSRFTMTTMKAAPEGPPDD